MGHLYLNPEDELQFIMSKSLLMACLAYTKSLGEEATTRVNTRLNGEGKLIFNPLFSNR
jgi:hypothetical protein